MPRSKVLALIMAGGAGNRLELLTERRAKPALSYAGVYRLIDFPLSNCVHSGVEDVWVLQQYRVQVTTVTSARRSRWKASTPRVVEPVRTCRPRRPPASPSWRWPTRAASPASTTSPTSHRHPGRH